MKTSKIICAIVACAFTGGIFAQTEYDVVKMTGEDLNGTARFVGMGGAMGALGGDMSTMGTNPAGIGIYRKNEIAATMGVSSVKFNGEGKTIPTFDNIGFVYSTKIGNNTSLRYVNFGFNYHRSKDLNNKLMVDYSKNDLFNSNINNQMSLTQIMAGMATGVSQTDFDDFFYKYPNNVSNNNSMWNVGRLGQLGCLGNLIEPGTISPKGEQQYLYTPANSARYYREQTGGVDEYDFNVACNVDDRFYFGATLGTFNVDYNIYSVYSEGSVYNNENRSFTLRNWQKTSGYGVNLKLGVIIRPIETSPFRIGLAVHTPTWFNLTNTYGTNLMSDYVTDEYNNINPSDMKWDYDLTTPWKFNVSLGSTFANVLALGAEYEYQDYTTSKLHNDDGSDMRDENRYMDEDLKGVQTFRVGMEAKLAPEFSLRFGYNFSSSVMKKSAYNYISAYNYTDAAFANGFQRNVFTCGLGYRGKSLYADLAYLYSTQKYDFYAFSDKFNADLMAKDVNLNHNKVLMTIGFRF